MKPWTNQRPRTRSTMNRMPQTPDSIRMAPGRPRDRALAIAAPLPRPWESGLTRTCAQGRHAMHPHYYGDRRPQTPNFAHTYICPAQGASSAARRRVVRGGDHQLHACNKGKGAGILTLRTCSQLYPADLGRTVGVWQGQAVPASTEVIIVRLWMDR